MSFNEGATTPVQALEEPAKVHQEDVHFGLVESMVCHNTSKAFWGL